MIWWFFRGLGALSDWQFIFARFRAKKKSVFESDEKLGALS